MIQPHFLRGPIRLLTVAILLLAASCSGGSKPVYPVTGKVLYDGKPAVGAVVHFHPQAKSDKEEPVYPIGVVDSNGEFKLSTFSPDDGAPPGKYGVTVTWTERIKGKEDMERTLVPKRYMDPKLSGLSAEVAAKSNELPPYQLTKK